MDHGRSLLTRRRLGTCSPGKYVYGKKVTSCVDCASGHYKTGKNSDTACKECENGQYSFCIDSYYAATCKLTKCTNCAAGFSSDDKTLHSSCDLYCSEGYYSTGAGEYPCPSCAGGYYSDSRENTGCKECTEGQYSTTASSTCTSCAAGYFTADAGSSACTACFAGRYAHTAGATACSLCPVGSFSNQTATTNPYCTACSAGYYSDVPGQTVCLTCPSGSYSDEADTSSSTCTSCVAGYYSVATTTQGNTICTECAAGEYSASSRSTACTDCSSGMYQNLTHQSTCLPCTPDMSCFVDSSTTSTVGVEVGATVGALLVVVALAAGALVYLRWRRQQQKDKRRPSTLGVPLLSTDFDEQEGEPPNTDEMIAWLAAAVKAGRRDWSIVERMCNTVVKLERSGQKQSEPAAKVLQEAVATIHAARAENQLLLEHAVTSQDYDYVAFYGLRDKTLQAALPSNAQPLTSELECVATNLLLHKDRFNATSKAFLGRGASGAVSKGFYLQTVGSKQIRTEVAVKEIAKASEASEEEAMREIMILKLKLKKRHANIINIFEVLRAPHTFFVVMQLCHFSLQNLSEEFRRFLHGPESAGGIVLDALVQDVLRAVAELHAHNIFHCDLKPANVLVSFNRDGKDRGNDPANFYLAQLVLSDFGVSRIFQPTDDESMTVTISLSPDRGAHIAGTQAFMAPEMIRILRQVKDGKVDAPELERAQLGANDAFGCGCVVAFLCSDCIHPFSSAVFPRIADNIVAGRRQSFAKFGRKLHAEVCEGLTARELVKRWSVRQALDKLQASAASRSDENSTLILLDQIEFHKKPNGGARQQLLKLTSGLPFLGAMLTAKDGKAAPLDAAMQKLKRREEGLPTKLDDDSYFALAAYTFDTGGDRADNVYFQLNVALRTRKSDPSRFRLWQGFAYYLMRALDQLEKLRTDVYRGCVLQHEAVKRDYAMGRPIQWAAFTSTSTSPSTSKMFIQKDEGVIFKIATITATNIGPYSFIPREEELLLSPNSQFVVTKELYIDEDGFACVDMVETRGGMLQS